MVSSKKIGDLLAELKFITKEQLNAALQHQKKNAPQKKVGEILVELGFLDELDLLKCLSGLFRVRYLSSDKLSKMTIPQWILDLIPLEFAEEYSVLPFFCYDKTKILSVAIPEPQDKQLPKLMKKVSGYHEIEPYLALASTIKAAIAKYYKNDPTAFDRLKGLPKAGSPSGIATFVTRDKQVIGSEYNESAQAALQQKDESYGMIFGEISDEIDLEAGREEPKRRLSDHIASLSLLTEDTLIEVLNIVINVLEIYKGEAYKGHSATVARVVKEISKNLGVEAKDTYYHVVGAYLHDCCMNSPKHLTLLHFDTDDSNGLLKKYSKYAERLFEHAKLPNEVRNIVLHTLERFDGKGYPYGLKGKGIPLGSRIIATVDAFIHLVNFEKEVDSENPYKSSFATIKSLANKYFDPEMIEGLAEVIVDRLVDDRSPRIIIIDADSEELHVLAMKLKKEGIFPYLLDDTNKATNVLRNRPISLIVSEVNAQPMDGFAFCKFIKTNEEYKDISFVLLSEKNDADTISKGFEIGADDFITKPYNPDILSAKINNFIKLETKKAEEAAEVITRKKGITGNLAEVQISDLIQMLSRGMQTGVLKLFKDEEQGEIFFDNGQVINARYNEYEKEEAFNLLIRWEYGLFTLDQDAELPEKAIHESTEMLLIEACRVWDEEKNNQKPS